MFVVIAVITCINIIFAFLLVDSTNAAAAVAQAAIQQAQAAKHYQKQVSSSNIHLNFSMN